MPSDPRTLLRSGSYLQLLVIVAFVVAYVVAARIAPAPGPSVTPRG